MTIRIIKNGTGLMVILLLAISISYAQNDWNVPSNKKNINNPFGKNAEQLNRGNDLYYLHCHTCHKDPGKNNVLPLIPPPVDPASEKMQSNTDGELFYKIAEGKGAMPQFKTTLKDNDIWAVVSFIRSLSSGTMPEQAISSKPPAIPGMFIRLAANKEEKTITAELMALKDDFLLIGIPNVELSFFVPRKFGMLEISPPVATDQFGVVKIQIPEDFPGDTNGLIELIVKVTDEDTYGKITKIVKAQIGKHTIPVNIFEKRVLWSWNTHTQWWIILSYLIVVLGIWSGILYVIYQVALIKLKAAKK